MVTMVGEIDMERYATLPGLHSSLRQIYQSRVGMPPASRAADLALVEKQRRGPNPHPTRSRRPDEE